MRFCYTVNQVLRLVITWMDQRSSDIVDRINRSFDFFGFPRTLFPDVFPSDETIGQVTPKASELTAIKAGTRMVNGSLDNSASALGAGMVKPRQVTLIIDTAG